MEGLLAKYGPDIDKIRLVLSMDWADVDAMLAEIE